MDGTVSEKVAERPLDTLKKGFFGALYSIQQRNVVGDRFFFLSTCTCALQLTYLPFSTTLGIPWSSAVLDIARPVLLPLNFAFIPDASEQLLLGLGIGWVTWTLLTLCLLFLVSGDSTSTNKKSRSSSSPSFLPFLAWSIHLQKGVFQLPIISTFIRILRRYEGLPKQTELNLLSDESQPVYRSVIQAVCVLCLILHVSISLVSALLLVHHVPYSQRNAKESKTLAAPHGRCEMIAVLCRVLVAIGVTSFAVFDETEPDKVRAAIGNALPVLLALMFIAAGSTVWVFLYYLPFYKMKLSRIVVVSHAMFLWAVFCAVLAYVIRNEEDYSSLFVFVVPLPYFLFSMNTLVSARAKRISQVKDFALMSSPYLVELHLRLKHQRNVREFTFSGDAEADYKAMLSMFPRSAFLALYVAALSTSAGNKIIFSLNLIKAAGQCPLQLDTEYFLYAHNRINEERQSDLSGAVSFMALDRHLESARTSIQKTLRYIAIFWRKVAHGSCKLNELLSLGSKVHEEASQSRYHLSKLLNMGETHLEGQRLYATYLHYVMNDKNKAMRVLQSVQHRASDHNGGYAVCTISGNLNTLGQFLDVSQAMCSFFGYNKSDMIGRSVNMIMPSPFDKIHDDFIKNFLSSDAEFTTQTRRIYGIHRRGFIMPIDFVLTPSTNAQSDLILIGKLGTDIPVPENQHMLLLEADTGIVTAGTQRAPEVLDVDEHDMYTMNVSITDIIPDFFQSENGLKYKSDQVTKINGQDFRVKATLLDFSRKSIECRVIIVKLTQVEEQTPFLMLDQRFRVGQSPRGGSAVSDPHETKLVKDGGPRNTQDENVGDATQALLGAGAMLDDKHDGDKSSVGSSALNESGQLDISRVQRKITADLGKKDPQLVGFIRFAKRFVFMFAVLMTLNYFLSKELLAMFVHENSGMKAVYKTSQLLAMSSVLVFYAISIPSNTSGAELDQVKLRLEALTSELKLNHEGAVENVKSSYFNVSFLETFFEEPVRVSYISANQSRLVSYQVMVLDYVNHLEKFLNAEFSASDCKEACQFVLNNGLFDSFAASLEVAEVYQERSSIALWRFNVGKLIVEGVLLLYLFGSFFHGYLPMFRGHGKRKRAIGEAFVSIPEEICRMLQHRSEKRLRSMNTSYDEGDMRPDEDDMDGFDDEDEELVAMALEENARRRPKKLARRSMSAKILWKKKVSPSRSIRAESWSTFLVHFLLSMLRIGISFWLILLFMMLTSFHRRAADAAMGELNAAVQLAGKRLAIRDAVQYWALRPLGEYPAKWDRSDISTYIDQELEQKSFALHAENFQLLYGNESRSFHPFRDVSGDLFQLYYGNICDRFEECSKHAGTALEESAWVPDFQQGLLFAFNSYMETVEAILERYRSGQEVRVSPSFLFLSPHITLSQGLEEAMHHYEQSMLALVDQAKSDMITATFILFAFLFVGHFISLGALSKMDTELKKTHTLLLMLPAEVFLKVPEVRGLLLET